MARRRRTPPTDARPDLGARRDVRRHHDVARLVDGVQRGLPRPAQRRLARQKQKPRLSGALALWARQDSNLGPTDYESLQMRRDKPQPVATSCNAPCNELQRTTQSAGT